MKIAVLCAFVFGAITVSGSSAPLEHRAYSAKTEQVSSSHNLGLRKRQEGGVAEAFAHAFSHTAPEAENAAHAANPAARGSTNYIFNEASRVPQAAPATAADNAMMEKILKNQKKIKKLVAQEREAAQLQQFQALRAAEEATAAKQVAAAPVAKSGGSWTKTKIAGGLIVGGLGGYGITKMLTTTPADSTTQYNPNDTAALTAAGGSAVPGAANAPAAGAGAGAGTGAGYGPGVYTDPKTGAQYSVDAAGNVSLVPTAGGAGVGATTGTVPASTAGVAPVGISGNAGLTEPATAGAAGTAAPSNGPGLYVDRTTGLQYYVDASGKATPVGSASGAGTAGSNPSLPATGATTTPPGSGAVAGGNTGAATGAATGASGAQQPSTAPAGTTAPATGTAATDATTGQATTTGTAAAAQPVWDASVNMYYVMGQDGTPYYIEPTSHMLINGKTGQVVDPQTGQVVDPNTLGAPASDGTAPTTGGTSPTAGTPNAGTPSSGSGSAKGGKNDGAPTSGTSSTPAPADGSAAGTKPPTTDSTSGKPAGGSPGTSSSAVQKRFIRKRQVDKRALPISGDAFRLASPETRAQLLAAYTKPAGPLVPANAVAAPAMSKTKLGLMVGGGLVAIFGTVLALDNLAHPKLKGTTEANPHGLQATKYCNAYGVPFIQDHWGTVWDKSTFTKVDPDHPPYMTLCSHYNAATVPAAQSGFAPSAVGAAAPQKRSIADHAADGLEKRAPLGWTAAGVAGVSGSLMYVMYLDKLHKQKEQALLNTYNNEYHTAGDAASSQGNSITTGAAGQLFNPMSGNLVLVDANSGQTYDSGTGEAVNSQTGLPLAYSSPTTATVSSAASGYATSASTTQNGSQAGSDSTIDPSLQQAMAEWNAKTPQEQQQLLAQYGQTANAIASSADPNATYQQYKNQMQASTGTTGTGSGATTGAGASSGLIPDSATAGQQSGAGTGTGF